MSHRRMRSYSYFPLYLSRVPTIAVSDDARSVGRSPWLLPLVHQHISIVRGGAWQLCARQLWLRILKHCCVAGLCSQLRSVWCLPACLPLRYGQNTHNRGQWSQRNILHLFYNVISFMNVFRSKMTPNTVRDTFSKQFVFILMTGWPCIVVYLWLIYNLMHKILTYLHIIHLLKSSTCFEHCPAHLQEVYVVIVYMQPLVSSLSAGDCPVHRLSSFLTGAQDSHLHRVTILEAAYIQLRCRPPEDEQGNARNM